MNAHPPLPQPLLGHLRRVSVVLALAGSGALWAASAPPSALPAASTEAEASTAYTVRRGDSLERIAQQHYPDSPVQVSAIVRELRALNATALGEAPARKRLKAGLVLQLPRHEQLVKRVLAPYVVQEEAERAQALQEQERRRWVRYP